MSKFHINKHGVPAPCRATKGNCPLGGASGDEGHFDTKEEAQAHADAVNQKEHGITPEMQNSNEVEVDQKDFDTAFQSSFDGGDGNKVTGISLHEFEEDYHNDEEFERVYNEIPDEVKDSDDKASTVIIPEKNIRAEMDANIVADGPLKEEIVNYATEKVKEESQFSMNDQKMYVQTDADRNRDFEQEYNDSGRREEFNKSSNQLSRDYDIEVDQADFNETFPDDYDSGGGFQVTGQSIDDFENNYHNDEEFARVYSQIPDEAKEKGEFTGIVPEKNIRAEMNNVIGRSDAGSESYDEMSRSVKQHSPGDVDSDGYIADGPLRDDIVNFAADKAKEESQITMNGQKMYVQTDSDRNRNYAEEYFSSGRHDEFKKNSNQLSKSYDVNVDQADFNETFPDDYDGGGGFQVTGKSVDDFENNYHNDKDIARVYSQIPDEAKKKGQLTGIVPEKNLRAEMNNMVGRSEAGSNSYDEMSRSVKQHSPGDVDSDGYIADGPLRDDIVNYAAGKAKEESQITMNGQKMYVQTESDKNRNFAEEYFSSGQYDKFKRENN